MQKPDELYNSLLSAGPPPFTIDFMSLLDSISEMIVYLDDQLHVLWANKRASQVAGFKREQMIGKIFFDVTCQKSEPCPGCPVIKGKSSKQIEVIENSFLTGRFYLSTSYPVYDQTNTYCGRVMVSKDITGLRYPYSATDTLGYISKIFCSPKNLNEICDELLKIIADQFKYPYGLITLYEADDGEITVVSEVGSIGRRVDVSRSYPISRCFSWKAIKNADIVNFTGLSQNDDFKNHVLRQHGVETILAIPLNVQGSTIGAIVLADKVVRTETDLMMRAIKAVANRLAVEMQRKKSQEALEKERNFTNAILNNAGALVLVLDKNGCISRFNKAFEKLTGYRCETEAGKPIWELFADAIEADFIRKFSPFTGIDNFPASFESIIYGTDKTAHLIEWSNSVMAGSHGDGAHIVCIGIDITQKRKMEEESKVRKQQLMEADKLASLGALTSGVAHEINNPNNFIMMNIPLLRNVWEDTLPILEHYYQENGEFSLARIPYSQMKGEIINLLDGIEDGAKRIKEMIFNMKDFVRKDTWGMSQSVNMNDVIVAALGLLSHEIKKSTKNVSLQLKQDLPHVKGNHQRLEQVVINLLQNACQALSTPEDAIIITTRYRQDKKRVVMEISDEGCGIAPGQLGCVFDPFFTTKSERGGTGLGLSVCRDIVQDHGGHLEFDSVPEKGTTATLLLPAIS